MDGLTRKRLQTTSARDHGDVQAFFDRSARDYTEQHGPAGKLLGYRLGLLRKLACLNGDENLLEIGCGDGQHLIALASDVAHGYGVDISVQMIAFARRHAVQRGLDEQLDFANDLGEALATVPDCSIDVAYCVGALEHMLDQSAVARSVMRVLKPGGRFVGLTPNGDYVWYRRLAPLLGLSTQHLSSDHFLGRRELVRLLQDNGFTNVALSYWRFIPRGDMRRMPAAALALLDHLGKLFRIGTWRGGLQFAATRSDVVVDPTVRPANPPEETYV